MPYTHRDLFFLSLLLYIKGAIYPIIVFHFFSFKGLVYISLEGLWFALRISSFFPLLFLFSPPRPSSPLLTSYDQIALSRSSSDRFLSASILVFFILTPWKIMMDNCTYKTTHHCFPRLRSCAKMGDDIRPCFLASFLLPSSCFLSPLLTLFSLLYHVFLLYIGTGIGTGSDGEDWTREI